jgi:hypothetical protein
LDLSGLFRPDLQSRPTQSPPLSEAPKAGQGSGFIDFLNRRVDIPQTVLRSIQGSGEGAVRLLASLLSTPVTGASRQVREQAADFTSEPFREGGQSLAERAADIQASGERTLAPGLRPIARALGPTTAIGASLAQGFGDPASLALGLGAIAGLRRGVGIPEAIFGLPRQKTLKALGRTTPKTAAPRTGTRKFATTVKESFRTNKELADRIEPEVYQQLSNKELVRNAKQLVKNDFDEALRIARKPGQRTAQSNAVAQETLLRLQKLNRYDEALDIIEQTSRGATTQGQAIQILSHYGRTSPAGILRYAQRLFDRANAERLNLNLKLDKALAEKLTESAQKLQRMKPSREKTIATARMLDDIFKEIPATLAEKVSHAQRIAQLLNWKTAVRNVVGNVGFAADEVVSDVVGTGLDVVVSALRGLFTGKPAAGFRSKTLPDLPGQLRAGKQGFQEALEEINAGVRIGPQTQLDIPKTRVFRGQIGSKLETGLDYILRVPDRVSYNAARFDELRNQMALARMRGEKLTKPTAAMEETADLFGLYRTFQDNNMISRGLSRVKRGLNEMTGNKNFGFGEAVLKYPKTPGALVARGIEYSPAGFVKSAFELLRPLITKQPFRQRQFIDATARAATGTGSQVVLGAYLHRLGIITGRREENRNVAEFRRETGLGEYRLNLSGLKRWVFSGFDPDTARPQQGDVTVNYDWFQPAAIGISMGANIDENLTDPKNRSGIGIVATAVNSIAGGAQTIAEQPLLQGLQRFFGGYDPLDSFVRTASGIPASFVPTLSNQIRQLSDNVSRNTYDPNTILYALNQVKSKIPGLSKTLPARVGPFGEVKDIYDEDANNLFNVFLNPTFVESLDIDPATQFVLDLYDEMGETGHFPKTAPKTINFQGLKFKLDARQMGELQTVIGRATHELIGQSLQDPAFRYLDPAEQARLISNAMSKIGQVARSYIVSDILSETLNP